MTAGPPLFVRSPLRCAEFLLASEPEASANLVLVMDALFATLVLRTLNALDRESYLWTADRRTRASAGRWLLMLHCGLQDHFLRTSSVMVFAADPELHRALERVATARLQVIAAPVLP